ncbi:SDR family oxidoreductase [Bacillus sp. AGMB 02131]|uniref:SDR family oxidoreductase n=1 Tax=Peribacillus faecalis TaxID=2772559 RepID=A0A927HBJ3_9BACI|nr:SDR family oxidoreductase [Peribacillus faecalis]MBD3109805.1 SDR family oxidoreductase [Peribacillus faecalis]
MRKKVALVTGGATGIGKKTLQLLADAQCDLVFTYVTSEEKAHLLCEQLQMQYGVKVDCFSCDVSDLKSCERLMKEIAFIYDGIDIYVHNAGPYIHARKTMMEYTTDEWQYIMNGNLNSFFYITKYILPHMRKERWGRIITLGFDRSDTAPGWIYRSAFAAAKSGLTSLTKTLAMEEASSGITVNMVCPGDITGQWKEATIEEAVLETEKRVPVGRPGTGEDIARVIAFLTDDKSGFITGSVIPVTGGVDVLGKVFRN